MASFQHRYPGRRRRRALHPRALGILHIHAANDLLFPDAGGARTGKGLLLALATSTSLWALIALGVQHLFAS